MIARVLAPAAPVVTADPPLAGFVVSTAGAVDPRYLAERESSARLCSHDSAGFRACDAGFAAALRRSELVALDAADVAEVAEGLVVTLRRSKTDQEGAGRSIGVPYGSRLPTCPVRALRAWREVAAISAGPLFRPIDRHGNISTARLSDRAVARVVQAAVSAAGFDPARFAGHSLRAGFATAAAGGGGEERTIAEQTGHRSMSVLRGYIRSGSLFRSNAAASVGL